MAVLYKVFLVEDEIVAREGIRDNVDWASIGFEFCGEAPDGEVALPLIESARPDVLITDIKMPFMDGLQLSKIIKERMPGIKIIILSGHDEFNYAQEAVKLGVTEYLLKPVGVKDLHNVLTKVAVQLDQNQAEQESLQKLHERIEDSQVMLQEELLLKLVMGGVSSAEAIEQSQLLDLDIIAAWYQVIVIRLELCQDEEQFNYYEYRQVRRIISGLIKNNPDVFLFRKDLEELVLILKSNDPEHLQQEGYFLTRLIEDEIANKTKCQLHVGTGHAHQRIGDIHQSFAEALARLQSESRKNLQFEVDNEADKAELLKLDKSGLEDFLKFGTKDEFTAFFDAYIQPLSPASLNTYLIKNYVFIDIVLTVAKFVRKLGGDIDQVIPEINYVETLLMNIKTVDQMRDETQKIFISALAFRDNQAGNQYTAMLHRAKEYIEDNYTNPDLSLNEVSANVNLSPSHFSTIFSREAGETFKEYLTRVRIDKAKELLRTTNLKSFEIAYKTGYNDPHYFSVVFKKYTSLSPRQFRGQGQTEQ